jgi:glutamyl-tRNA synthetase
MKKLEWMNGQHLAMLNAAELVPLVTREIIAAGLATEQHLASRQEWLLTLIDLLKVRARTIDDMVRQAAPFLTDEIVYEPDAVAKQWKDRAASGETLRALWDSLQLAPQWDAEGLEEVLRELAATLGVGAGKLFQPLRVALTGSAASPGIFDVLILLGRARSLERIDAAVRYLTVAA